MNKKDTILVIGSAGQIGAELVAKLREIHGTDRVVAADLKVSDYNEGPFEILDVLDAKTLLEVVNKYNITQVYLLAALLSATAENNPKYAWKLNMEGLFNVLDLAKEKKISRVYWPSSIAVFGINTPRENTPQFTIMEPSTIYGISKLAGERWCEYYFNKYNVDVRSLRYPGLVSYTSAPGGGTTDYAIHIFHEALNKKTYECFLSENTALPMMYMPDAINATIKLMETEMEKIKIRSSYNIGALSFSPKEIALKIKQYIPDFEITYKPDYRQQIADSWPKSIDDSFARGHWGWEPNYTLEDMIKDMLKNLSPVKLKSL